MEPGEGGTNPSEKYHNKLFESVILHKTNSKYIRSSECKEKSLFKKSGSGDWSNFSHKLDKFQKSKIYKGKSVAEVFLQAPCWFFGSHLENLDHRFPFKGISKCNTHLLNNHSHCNICMEIFILISNILQIAKIIHSKWQRKKIIFKI